MVGAVAGLIGLLGLAACSGGSHRATGGTPSSRPTAAPATSSATASTGAPASSASRPPKSGARPAPAPGRGNVHQTVATSDLRGAHLEVTGADLLAAGVPESPALGAALEETLRRKLDGQVSGRDAELAAALEIAREGSG